MSVSNQKHEFAIVIPAYNETATIRDIAKRALAYSTLVIVVDDGSTDDTASQLDDISINFIKHEKNKGKAVSLWTGIQFALHNKVKYIVTLDADGQHRPEDIPMLLDKAKHKPNHIIIGARLADKSSIPAKRYYANRIANFWISWAAGYPISDSQSGFRVYPYKLFDDLTIPISKRRSFVFESEILIKAAQQGIRSVSVAIPAIYEKSARASHFRGVSDITLITLMVGRSLLSRGLYLPGLYRGCIVPHAIPRQDDKTDTDGYLMLGVSCLLMLLTAGTSLLLAFLYVLLIAIDSTTQCKANKIVIFGKRLRNNLPGLCFRQRLDRAVSLVKDNADKQIYILGGIIGSADISEAQAGRDYLQDHIETNNIYLEQASRNTLENLKNLKTHFLQDDNHISLITNRYHLARASLIAEGFGFKIERCSAEEAYSASVGGILTILAEAFHLHWYLTGRVYAKLTGNQRMLSRLQ